MEDDTGGLLGNLPLQMGLGILANNYGKYGALAPALGAGMQQGMQGVQQFQQLQRLKQMQDMQMKRMQDEQDRQKKMLDWQSSFGKPNTQQTVNNGYTPAPQYDNAPNFNMQKLPDTTQESFDPNKWMLDGVAAGAMSPLELMKLNRGEHEYDFKDGVMFDKKTGSAQMIGDNKQDKMPDKVKQYEYAVQNGFKGSFTDFLRIIPDMMLPIQQGQLGIAQQNADIAAKNSDYNTGAKPLVKPQPTQTMQKVATLKDIEDTARASGKSTKQVTKDLRDKGFIIK